MSPAAQCAQVLRGGGLTTVQDLGRNGWRHLGIAHGGALDIAQAAIANRMVGNPPEAAVLELTLRGPTLAFDSPVRIALSGARIDARFIDARFQDSRLRTSPVPCGRPVLLTTGTLELGTIRAGLRVWLAIAGGIDVPRVLGSRSTDLRGGFGGINGRELHAGDTLPIGAHAAVHAADVDAPPWWIALDDIETAHGTVRYVAGDAPWAHALAERAWTIDPRSNRQGLRCAGDAIIADLPEQVSAPVAPGTIQLPPDGQPIVLLADAQTIGGYPRLGHVISADLPRLAQSRPGDTLRFVAVDAAAARAAAQHRRNEIARLHWAIDRALHKPQEP